MDKEILFSKNLPFLQVTFLTKSAAQMHHSQSLWWNYTNLNIKPGLFEIYNKQKKPS